MMKCCAERDRNTNFFHSYVSINREKLNFVEITTI